MSLLAENPPSTKIVADCRHGNLRCHLWRQSWHHDDARFSVVSFPVTPWPRQGALTRYPRLLVVRAPGMPGTFSPPPTSKKTVVSDPGIHHGTCATHWPWCMSGSLTRGVGENVPGIPGACATRNFAYLIRGPLERPFWNSLCGVWNKRTGGLEAGDVAPVWILWIQSPHCARQFRNSFVGYVRFPRQGIKIKTTYISHFTNNYLIVIWWENHFTKKTTT